MSTQRANAPRTTHVSEHRGLLMLLSLAVLAGVIVAVDAILATTRPATTVLTPDNAAAAEQARLEFRRGEWMAGNIAPAAAAEQARLEFRRGEWMAGNIAPAAAAEQARLEFRRGEWMAGSAPSAAAVERARLSYRRGEWNPDSDLAAAAEKARLEYRRGEWTGQ